MRGFLVDRLNQTILSGEVVPPDQTLGALSMSIWSTTLLIGFNGTLMSNVSNLLDTALAATTKSHVGIFTGVRSGLEIIALIAVAQNVSSKSRVPETRALSSYAAALKLRSQVSILAGSAIKPTIVNSPVTVVSSANTTTGDTLLELSLYRATRGGMMQGVVETGTVKIITPRLGVFEESTHYNDDVRAITRQMITCTFASWLANPYAYDTYRVLKSGITMIRFSKLDQPAVSLSGLPLDKRPFIGLKLSFVSGAPKCFFREAYKDYDGYIDTALRTSRHQHTIGSNVSEVVFCETAHNTATDDYVISDGCYQHRLYTRAQTCSSHGFCNLDSTCHCVCGYFSVNCSSIHVSAM